MNRNEFVAFLRQHASKDLDDEDDREALADAYIESLSEKILILHDLIEVGGGCPSAWEARTEDGKEFYARYRWGAWYMSVNDRIVAEGTAGSNLGGVCGWEELLSWAADQVTVAVRSWKLPLISEEDQDVLDRWSQLVESTKSNE